MVNRHFILFALAFAAALSGVAKTFDIDISTGRPAAANEAYYHGETIEFRAVRGRSVVTNVEYSCVYYQTNGMDSAWWHTDGLVFHPTNDVGAASYRFFLEGRDDLGRDWHANGLLRLLPSPGFTPNTIELPVARLDFAAVEVANAPYYDKTETEAKIVELAPAPGDYAAVSNAAMTALQSYTETDPTVKAWAKAATKPTYTAAEVGALSTGGGDVNGDVFVIGRIHVGKAYDESQLSGIEIVDGRGNAAYYYHDHISTGNGEHYDSYLPGTSAAGANPENTLVRHRDLPTDAKIASIASDAMQTILPTNFPTKIETDGAVSQHCGMLVHKVTQGDVTFADGWTDGMAQFVIWDFADGWSGSFPASAHILPDDSFAMTGRVQSAVWRVGSDWYINPITRGGTADAE